MSRCVYDYVFRFKVEKESHLNAFLPEVRKFKFMLTCIVLYLFTVGLQLNTNIFLISGSVSVPSVTVVVVAFWVRGNYKYSAPHLCMKHLSAITVRKARQATAVMAT